MDNSAPDRPDQTLSRRRPASRSSISTMTRRPTAPSWRACRSSSAILDSSSAPAHAHWPSASSSSSRPSRAEFRRYASPLVTSDVERDRSLKTETIHTHTHTHVSEARDSEWQWHQLVHMQVCTSLQTDNHASTSQLSFLQAGCPSCRPTNRVKALKETETRPRQNC